MAQLSFLIPARNEQFLARTVQDLLDHTTDASDIIVGMDGAWADPVIVDHPRVKIYHVSESIGQRAMTNRLARISDSKYLCKVDAHCSFDQDWDVKMLEAFKETGDDVTMVSIMRNLYAFDWVCPDGHHHYQDKGDTCECGKSMTQDIIWRAKDRPNSTSYRFDKNLEFNYWNEYKAKQEGDLVESLSLQGSCFMLTKAKYFELNICDETWGSWGGQGAEVALKTWLSGGRVVVNRRTWYAHMFRTKQHAGFGFPYPNPWEEQQKAKSSLKDTFLTDQWPLAKMTLRDLLDKFAPVPDWDT